MASRKRNKRNLSLGRKIMIVLVIGLLIGIALVVKNIVSLSIEKRELMEKNSELTDKRDELTAELENVNDLDYIEEQARKLLHMIKPGEILYILNGSGHPKDENGNTDIELPTQPVWNEPEETTETEEVQEEAQEVEEVQEEVPEEEVVQEVQEESYSEESGEETYSEEGSEENAEGGEESSGD
ncbi:MAG: septum formation initiator family protein [Firmicutes bacterium]|nr:septum formation initiator family protein [Bacillota bacterium]